MGKASRWFRGLFGQKKSTSSSSSSSKNDTDHLKKRRWIFVKSYREKEAEAETIHHHPNDKPKPFVSDSLPPPPPTKNDTEKHAIAVAAATAAASVVKLTGAAASGPRNSSAHVSRGAAAVTVTRREWAAVRIQSAYRGCLARKALRALKGLVKLQALVRGHIERKRTAEWLHRMQVLMQAQARAIVGRSDIVKPNNNNNLFLIHPGPSTPEKVEHVIRSRSRKFEQPSLLRKNSSKRSMSDDHDHDHKPYSYNIIQFDDRSGNLRMYSARNNDERPEKVVEMDVAKRRNLFHKNDEFRILEDNVDLESPQYQSATSSRRSPFTPTKSDGSVSFFSDYCPSYMSCTESSKAKVVRSMSAPKQRPYYERSGSTKRYSINGLGDPRQKITTLHSNFVNKAYPGSGRLDKLGMPIGYRYY